MAEQLKAVTSFYKVGDAAAVRFITALRPTANLGYKTVWPQTSQSDKVDCDVLRRIFIDCANSRIDEVFNNAEGLDYLRQMIWNQILTRVTENKLSFDIPEDFRKTVPREIYVTQLKELFMEMHLPVLDGRSAVLPSTVIFPQSFLEKMVETYHRIKRAMPPDTATIQPSPREENLESESHLEAKQYYSPEEEERELPEGYMFFCGTHTPKQ